MEINRYQNYIDGQWCDSISTEMSEIKSPCNGETVSIVAKSNINDVNKAVAAAKRAFYEEDWAFNPRLRSAALNKWAAKMRENFNDIVVALSLESGKPLNEARIEVNNAIGYMEYSAASARTLYGSQTTVEQGMMNILSREPVGIVVGIEPWNYPITLMIRDSIPALAAGNTLIIKPAAQTSGASMAVIKLAADIAEFPRGVLNAITGPGSLVGTAFVAHKDVDMITFTGGLDTGKDIMRRAADTMKKVSLELGGKSANVVFASCDFEKALDGGFQSYFLKCRTDMHCGSRLCSG